ncbi:alpha-(1-_3)-arabinofuranosyltransferase family protein [Paenibacillus aurantiacus]|uniref:Alpha-(1->3)-arabinofuranosyltransferase family protein n=1 Tax=Paenibacillus aurantiacus TaxID=1936118 RepID=A0ABV5KP04_9BACL
MNFSWMQLKKYYQYYVVFLVLTLVSASIFWFDAYIAGGDVYPSGFIPDNQELDKSLSLWGTFVNGFGSPQFSSNMFIQALWGKIVGGLGFSGYAVQYLFYTTLLIWQGWATVYFMRAFFPERNYAPIFAAIAMPLSLFNAITFINPIMAFALGYAPWIAGLLVHHLRQPQSAMKFGIQIGFTSLGLFLISANPPSAVFFVLWTLLWLAVCWYRWRQIHKVWRGIVLGIVLAVLLNCWWAYAAYITLYGSPGTVEQTFKGPLDYQFVHQNASIINLLSFQGIWNWPRQEYYPWAKMYYTNILMYASLYVPVLFALYAFFFSAQKKRKLVLLGILGLSLFMAKGLHAPFSQVNGWMYTHIPLFWLFRDPQVQFNIPIYLSIFALAALSVDEWTVAIKQWASRVARPLILKSVIPAGAGLMLLFCLALNGGALISGAFLSINDKGAVKLPGYWEDIAQAINASDDHARVLLLPNNDFYQMGYDWGYYGIDYVAQSLIHKPVLLLEPQVDVYLGGSAGYMRQVQQLYKVLKENQSGDITPLLEKMGIKWLILRHDITTESIGRNFIPPEQLSSLLQGQKGIKKVGTFEKLDLYEIQQDVQVVDAYDGYGNWITEKKGIDVSTAYGKFALTPWLQNAEDAIIHGFQDEVEGIQGNREVSANTAISLIPRTFELFTRVEQDRIVVTAESLAIQIGDRPFKWESHVNFQMPEKASSLKVSIGDKIYQLDEHQLVQKNVRIGSYSVNTENMLLPVKLHAENDSTGTQEQTLQLYPVTQLSRTNEAILYPEKQVRTSIALTNWGELFDANAVKALNKEEAGLVAERENENTLMLKATENAAGIGLQLPDVSDSYIHISLKAQSMEGSKPLIRLINNESGMVIWESKLQTIRDWQTIEQEIYVGSKQSNLSLYFYAFAEQSVPTSIAYKDIRVDQETGATGSVLALNGESPNRLPMKTDKLDETLTIEVPKASKLVVYKTSYHDGWKLKSSSGETLEWEHVLVDGYMNGWIVPKNNDHKTITIEFAPSKTFNFLKSLAVVIFILSLLTAGWLLYLRIKKHREERRT